MKILVSMLFQHINLLPHDVEIADAVRILKFMLCFLNGVLECLDRTLVEIGLALHTLRLG